MLDKIVLAGGSGYLGQVLTRFFKDKAREIIILSRGKAQNSDGQVRVISWDAASRGDWETCLQGADVLVNLCGKNVNCRYTAKAREEIFRSRLVPTALLGEVISGMPDPPKHWINIASATIYCHAEDRPQDETTGDIGTGFSVDVCKTWEESFWQTETPGTRKTVLRVGLVLGQEDGVFPRLKRLVQVGLGGHQGSGKQYVSWIHEHDFTRMVHWILNYHKEGTYNCTAPGALPNREFMKTIRQAYGVPVGLPSPQWLLEIGARLIGTETELVLKSRWVQPQRAIMEGFNFQFPEAGEAIREILSSRI